MRFRNIPHQEPLDPLLVKHTPAPWYPGRFGGTVCSVNPTRAQQQRYANMLGGEVREYGGYLVGEGMGKKGDVALIASAPDMYALLKKLHDWLSVNATGKQALDFQVEIQELFFEIWRMGDKE